MTGYQHKLIGMATATAVVAVTAKSSIPINDVILGALLGGAGAMIPDIDHNNSKLGSERKRIVDSAVAIGTIFSIGILGSYFLRGVIANKFGIVVPKEYYIYAFCVGGVLILSWLLTKLGIVKWMIRHRGLMHTTLPIFGLLFIGKLMYIDPKIVRYIAIGFGSHLFADCLTISGCPLLFPFSTKTISFVRGKDKKVTPEVRKKRVNRRFSAVTCLLIIISIGGLYAKQRGL